MLPGTPSPTSFNFMKVPVGLLIVRLGDKGHSSLNKERAQGLGCMLFGASDRGEYIGSPEHLKCKSD